MVDNLYITRHIINEYGKYAFGKEHVNRVSSIVPGVMAQTGMESMEIVNGIVKETKPDVVIAIDALADKKYQASQPDHSGDGHRESIGKRCRQSQTRVK